MIVLDNESNIPLYIQIYEQMKQNILTEQILGGSKLPSIRMLSNTLKVSRNTVESAYMQLASEGYIESKPGSGYIVLRLESLNHITSDEPNKKIFYETRDEQYQYNFRNRGISTANFPTLIWKRLSNNCLSAISLGNLASYNSRFGELELQIEIMKYLHSSRGINCLPEQIIITSGMEYSLSLLCQLFREEFTDVAFEEPGYMVARSTFQNNGYTIRPISIESDGLCLEELERSPARMVYITPSHQFPLGYTMPIQKRLKLLDWAKRRNGYIIEDDYDSEFRYNSRPIPALQSIDSTCSVIYIGTFSKSLSPSLRVNYMVLPNALLHKYDTRFNWYRVSVSYIQQKILAQFMSLGYWDRHLRKIHLNASKKHDTIINAIQKYFGEMVIIHGEHAGLHIVIEFINGLKEAEVIEKAQKASILVLPVSIFWLNKENYRNNMIMLGYGGMPETEIEEGIKALKNALSKEN